MAQNFDRIKGNVKKMVDMNAPEKDVDDYIASEGVTLDQVKTHRLPPPPEAAEPERGWGDVAQEAVGNIPQSAMKMATEMGEAITHPIETVQNISKIGAGAAQYAAGGLLGEGFKPYAGAVADFYKGRYGSEKDFKAAVAQDPVGIMSDFATVLSGGGGLASKIGPLSKAGQVVQKASQLADPLSAAAGKAASHILGMTTGAGADAIKGAYRAGKSARKTFKKNIRGKEDIADVLEKSKHALNTLRQQKNAEYAKDIGKTTSDPQKLDIAPIQKAIDDLRAEQTYQGFAKAGKETTSKLDEISAIMDEFSKTPEIHNATGLDALKQRVGDINIPMESRQAERIRSSVYSTIKDTIEAQSPQYAKTMKNYTDAQELIRNIEKSMSLGKRATEESGVRKLMGTMKGKTKLSLIKQLEKKTGINLMDAIAGQALSDVMPSGLIGKGLGVGAGVGGATTPALLATLPAFSPRLMGELAYFAGATGKAVPRGLIQSGRANLEIRKMEQEKELMESAGFN